MRSVTNLMNQPVQQPVQHPVVVQSVPSNIRQINFKAGEVDQFLRSQSGDNKGRPSAVPRRMSQQDMMAQMMMERQKEQKKAKRKQNWMSALQVAGILSTIAFVGFMIWRGLGDGKDQEKAKALAEKVKEIVDPRIKREAEEELSRQSYERSLYRVEDLIEIDRLNRTSETKVVAEMGKVKERLQKVVGMDEAKDSVIKFLESINYDISNGIDPTKPIILCLDGPPGTGKSTLMKAIAEALEMYFKKISLSGTNNIEAVTGFERTYAGATPGLIAKAQLEGGTKRVVYGLDEFEKTSEKVQNAFLDILDGSGTFTDKYYNSKIDLSQSIFILTTNDVEKLRGTPIYSRIAGANLIKINPYNAETKTAIARLLTEEALKANKMFDRIEIPESIYKIMAEIAENDTGGRGVSQLSEKLIQALKGKLNKSKTFEVTDDYVKKLFENVVINS